MLVETRKISKGKEVTVVTSLDVAETFGKRHSNVLRDIENLECSSEFRELNFELTSYKDKSNREQPMYYITRDGFTLLVMSYTGEKAMKFKEAYINQFNQMEELLKGKLIEREKGIAVRQSLTKAIQQSSENERMHGHAYSTYTDIVYRTVFGKTAKQLREEYGIDKKANLRDCFTVEELEKVQSIEMIISGLVNCGWGYNEIKEFITNPAKKLIAA
uniref:Regulatory protein n=1 Tax=Siphoviridae sp. ctu9a31 TaxID=2825712 RepID=A0A8S5QAK8_9CAUD|nr:MAG TPA: regulatory protein [Siphoviridae sp. ctu9a31]DAH26479.1 MAG TPA: regulatory protein [Caudoviricetes sp.]